MGSRKEFCSLDLDLAPSPRAAQALAPRVAQALTLRVAQALTLRVAQALALREAALARRRLCLRGEKSIQN